ncbi:MAG TPA: hypothetical protein VEW42_01555, partial [Candidatus Eisenbacteria bacterium]|nr:hypothetical protein [Candidatus Eisenbacteria bacterium]
MGVFIASHPQTTCAYNSGSCCCNAGGNLPRCSSIGVSCEYIIGNGLSCQSGYSFVSDNGTCPTSVTEARAGQENFVCAAQAAQPTCNEVTGGFCNIPGHGCNTNYTYASSSYECSDACCRPMTCSDLSDTSSFCGLLGHSYAGRTPDYANGTISNTCSSGVCWSVLQSCNGGDTQTSGCDSTNPGFNTCGTYPGTYQVTRKDYTHPSCNQAGTSGNGYTCTASTDCNATYYYPACTTGFENHCNAGGGYACINNNTCVTNIFVHVYTDYNHTATNNGGGKSGVTISDNAGNTPQTDGSGNVTFTSKPVGNYTISETVPANFQATNATSQGVSLTNNNGNVTVNFYLTPLYSISGRVFNDTDKNQRYDSGDTGYGGGTIHISGGPTAVADRTAAGDGTWSTPTNLLAGTYLVSYTTSLAAGYKFTTPSSYSVTVGNPAGSIDCNVGGSLDGTCGGTNSGSIANLDIGLTNEIPWHQSVCLDVRDDSGTYANLIPQAPNCGGVSG